MWSHGQLLKAIRNSAAFIEEEDEDASTAAASTEAIEELRRLRETQVAVLQNGTVAQVTPADPTQPATIPAGVPKLPARFQSTEQIRELTRLVLSTSASEMEKSRVGFWFVDF